MNALDKFRKKYEQSYAFDKDNIIERLRKRNIFLEQENLAANKRIEELFKEKQELERKYNLLRYGR